MTKAESKNRNKSKSSKRKLRIFSRAAKYAAVGFACTFMILCAALIYLKTGIKREHEKAVQEYHKDNYFEAVKKTDRSVHIKGSENGQSYDYVEDGRLCDGIKIWDIDVKGLDYAEARALIINHLSETLSNIKYTVNAGNTRFMITAGDLGITSNVNEVLAEAFKIGRRSPDDYLQNYLEREQTAKNGIQLIPELRLDNGAVSAFAKRVAKCVKTEPSEPYITLTDRYTGANSTKGASALDIYGKITVYTPFKTPVADIVFHRGTDAFELDSEDLIAKIFGAFADGNYEAEFETVCKKCGEPKVKAEELMDSMKKISSFSTSFKTSGRNRSFNQYFGASKLNCMVMTPGEEISFNQYLGERKEIDGWKLAHQIVNGNEYVDTAGGGLCQISTTLYNALMLTGAKMGPALDDAYEEHLANPLIENPLVEIIDRSHHSIPSDYVDKGLDATVSYGFFDLKWKCIGDSPLFLFSYTDSKKKILYMDVYGSVPDDGCSYKFYSKLVSTIMPEPPLEIPEPLWPAGFEKMMIKPRQGYIVNVFLQKYDLAGKALGDPIPVYTDEYLSVQGQRHYGTGSPNLPKPEL